MPSRTWCRPLVLPSSGSCRGRCVGASVPRAPAGCPPSERSWHQPPGRRELPEQLLREATRCSGSMAEKRL